jgi:hypothetical protein
VRLVRAVLIVSRKTNRNPYGILKLRTYDRILREVYSSYCEVCIVTVHLAVDVFVERTGEIHSEGRNLLPTPERNVLHYVLMIVLCLLRSRQVAGSFLSF